MVGTNGMYKINKYDIDSQGWYLPVSRRTTKALKKKKRYKENITKELDTIRQHMKCELCTMERGGVLQIKSGSTRRNQEVNRDKTGI